jgi:uncharacterized protein (DUF302 family)
MSTDGLITISSRHSVKETIDRLATALAAKGIAVFARIDHGAGAASVALALRPTELLIFGSPKGGTPLMQARQSIGIDLPLKMLAWQDESGKVRLSYNDIGWLARPTGSAPKPTPRSRAWRSCSPPSPPPPPADRRACPARRAGDSGDGPPDRSISGPPNGGSIGLCCRFGRRRCRRPR